MAKVPIFQNGLPLMVDLGGLRPAFGESGSCNCCGDDPCTCFSRNGAPVDDPGYGCDLPWIQASITKTEESVGVFGLQCEFHVVLSFSPPAGVTVTSWQAVAGTYTVNDETEFDIYSQGSETCGQLTVRVWYSTAEECPGEVIYCFGVKSFAYQCCECGECSGIQSPSTAYACTSIWWFAPVNPEYVYVGITSSGGICDPPCYGSYVLSRYTTPPWNGGNGGAYLYINDTSTEYTEVRCFVGPCEVAVSATHSEFDGEETTAHWHIGLFYCGGGGPGIGPVPFIDCLGDGCAVSTAQGLCCGNEIELTGVCSNQTECVDDDCGPATVTVSCTPLPPLDPPEYPYVTCDDLVSGCGQELEPPLPPAALYLSLDGFRNDAYLLTGADIEWPNITQQKVVWLWRNLNRGFVLERATDDNPLPAYHSLSGDLVFFQTLGTYDDYNDAGVLFRADEDPLDEDENFVNEFYMYSVAVRLACTEPELGQPGRITIAEIQWAYQQFVCYTGFSDPPVPGLYYSLTFSDCLDEQYGRGLNELTCFGACAVSYRTLDYQCLATGHGFAHIPVDIENVDLVATACLGAVE